MNLTEEAAVSAIKQDGHFGVGDISYSYSSSVSEGLVMGQSPNANRPMTEGTKINIEISKGEEPAATVTVPDLRNMTAAEAEDALAARNLIAKAGDSVYSSDVPAGQVVSQDPAANSTAKAGDTVTYCLSKGAEMVTVPSGLVGSTLATVESALDEAGLEHTTTKQGSTTYAEGLVISVSPGSGSSVEKGSSVTITVSSGPTTSTVPNVVGHTESAAKSMLGDFTVVVQEQSSTAYSAGMVMAQTPSGGKAAALGSTVTITVSTGPAAGEATPGANSNGAGDD